MKALMQRMLGIAVLLTPFGTIAQSVSLDPTFGNNGISYFAPPFSAYFTSITNAIIQPDDKVVSVGKYSKNSISYTMVSRCNADGTVDTTFGDSGSFRSPQIGYIDRNTSAGVLSDGSIAIAGDRTFPTSGFHVRVTKLTANGQLDSAFANNGVYYTKIGFGTSWTNDIVVLDDDRIVAMGNVDDQTYLLYLMPDGTPDVSKGNNGVVIFTAPGTATCGWTLTVDGAGRLLVSGGLGSFLSPTGSFVTRILTSGQIDASFGNGGHVLFDEIPNVQYTSSQHGEAVADVVCDQDNNIFLFITTVIFTPRVRSNHLVKLDPAGQVDVTFGDQGRVSYIPPPGADAVPRCMAMTDQSEIILAGRSNNAATPMYIIRVSPAGQMIDVQGGGAVNLLVLAQPSIYNVRHGVVVQSTGRIVVTVELSGGADGLIGLQPMISTSATTVEDVSNQVQVFPNPCRESFSLSGLNSNLRSVELYDMLGKRHIQYSPTANYALPANLNSGKYFVRLQFDGRSEVLPLIIAH